MGNMKQESKFDPENIQDPAGGTKDPSNLTSMSQGWGLIQWTPGNKIIGLAKEAGVSGPLYELSTQLNLVWQHMNNHPDVTGHFDLNHFKSINDEVEAGAYFGSQIEGFQIAGNRLQDATDILHKYAGSGGGNGSSSSSSGDSSNCTSNSSSPDCATADGNAKILCEAKKYDPVNYSWGGGHNGGAAYHQACSTIEANDSSCALDCSGLVSVAVYDAFRANLVWTTNTLAGRQLRKPAAQKTGEQP